MCQLFQNGFGAVVKDAALTCSRVFFQLSSEEKSLLRRTELAYRKKNEEDLNAEYRVRLDQVAEDFEKIHSTLKEKKPKVFLKDRERAIFQASQQMLREEQAKLWPQSMAPNVPLFLRDIKGNFVQDRWLECLLCEDKDPETTCELIKDPEAKELDYDIFNYNLKDIQNKYVDSRLGKFAELVIHDTQAEVKRLRRPINSNPGQDLLHLYRRSGDDHKKLLFMVTLTKCNMALVKLQAGLFEELFKLIPSLRIAVGDNQKVLDCFETLEHLQGVLNSKVAVRNTLSITLPKDFKADDKRKIRDIAQELSRQNKELSEAFAEFQYVLQGKKEEIEKDKGTSVPVQEKEPKQMESSSKSRKIPSARGRAPTNVAFSPPHPILPPISPPTHAPALLSARVKQLSEQSPEQKKDKTATLSSPLENNTSPNSARKLTNEATPNRERGKLTHTMSFMVRPVGATKPTMAKGAHAVRSPDASAKVGPLVPPGKPAAEMHQEFGELVKLALASKGTEGLPKTESLESPGKQGPEFRQEFDELIKIVNFYKTVEQLSAIFQRIGKLLPCPPP